jgi:hypothetical protein
MTVQFELELLSVQGIINNGVVETYGSVAGEFVGSE